MTIKDLEQRNIGILGFGQEGQAVLEYLTKHGVRATIFDESLSSDWSVEAKELAQNSKAKIIDGPGALEKISECSLVFRSPGVWRQHPQILTAEQAGTVITSQAKWFFENCPSVIVGVTGTKGKGTTCSLIYQGLNASGKSAYLTGNIGKQQPLSFLDDLKEDDIVVYELSSFQLQDLNTSPHIGICLMVTSDHLNHHANLDEYHEAKTAITAFQGENDWTIYNADYEASQKISTQGKGIKLAISSQLAPKVGAFITESIVKIVFADGKNFEFDFSKRQLRGQHNMENLAAATLALLGLEVEQETIISALCSFAGLEHRLQFVGKHNDVSFYNDSISTVPETTVAAVNSFAEPVHLFFGGSNKGLEYDQLISELSKKANLVSITLLGETGELLKPKLAPTKTNTAILGPYTDFSEAFSETISRTNPGDVVLLSPGAASFDMFKNYADRGKEFENLVNGLGGSDGKK